MSVTPGQEPPTFCKIRCKARLMAAFAFQHRGKVSYDAEEFADARADFKRALFLRQQAGAPEEQLESTLLAIEAADRRRSTAVAS